MDQAAERYLTRLRRALVCSKKDKERLLADARDLMENFTQENPGAFYQDYVASFGQPQDFAREMLSGLDPEDVAEARLRRKRGLIGAIAAVAAVGVLLVGVWFGRQSRTAGAPTPPAEQTPVATQAPTPQVSPGADAVSYAEREFADSGDIAHKEAVGTLVRLGIMAVNEEGCFYPAATVTRAEMAKLISVVMNGGDERVTGVKAQVSFSDISGHWAEGYIEYCVDLGIITAVEDEPFRPNEDITGYELLKMTLAALGYDPIAYRLNGEAWAVRTDELACHCDPALYAGLDGVVMAQPVTRDNAAQVLYNALQNKPRLITPTYNEATQETLWEYQKSEETFLKERFGRDLADIDFDDT